MDDGDWQERLSLFQRILVKSMAVFGYILWFVGVQFSVRKSFGAWPSVMMWFGGLLLWHMIWKLDSHFTWFVHRRIRLFKLGPRVLFWPIVLFIIAVDAVSSSMLFVILQFLGMPA